MRHTAGIRTAAFSPDGRRVVTGGWDNKVRVWDAETCQPLGEPFHTRGDVSVVAFSPDGRRVLGAASDGAVRIWDTSPLLSEMPPSWWTLFAKLAAGVELLPSGILDYPRVGSSPTKWQTLEALIGQSLSQKSYDLLARWYLARVGPNSNLPPTPFAQAPMGEGNRDEFALSNLVASAYFARQQGSVDKALAVSVSWFCSTPQGGVRLDEWQQAKQRALAAVVGPRVPPRNPETPARFLDLTGYYNAALTDELHEATNSGNNLSALPTGRQRPGTATNEFDIRGVLHLQGGVLANARPEYPDKVSGIPVRAKARSIHFLQGCGWEVDPSQPDKAIGAYHIRYEDGRLVRVPILYGEHVRNWYFDTNSASSEKDGAVPVWTEAHDRWRNEYPRRGVRLYQQTWLNPRPGIEISTLDFVTTKSGAAPFLIAITLDH